MNDIIQYRTAKGEELKVSVCDKEGRIIPEDVKLDLPELRDFLTRIYATRQTLTDNAS